MCTIDNGTSLIIKKTRKDTHIVLCKGKTYFKLTPGIYELICDAKVSVWFLRSYLEQNAKVAHSKSRQYTRMELIYNYQ